ncbi:phage terminase, large subunit [Myxococcus stipitatus DSM 14675]|uniref:Phage terminase, large subunit n=1 Tax=Myxococcus stipitatus (strain DSM 14675 / JCM 12634 / Mx s8) TaxID=1278073 RepID=L7U9X3_MYXSD|nr:phage terminase large subunit family protein [Myxococcus stipitatus]AGC43264.1 phage terminase, large subunit [Myxococcus stipitatus DSM 14675]
MSDYADPGEVVRAARAAWAPPPKLTLSQWADEYFYLSAESSAEPGRWRTLPYQRGIMDAFTDSAVSYVSVIKSARVGWTKILGALIGYCIHQAPASILLVMPTVEDAKGTSKEEIAPMIRDCPVLTPLVHEDADVAATREGSNTILHKRYPGGVLSLVGANSGTGFRRISRKVVLFDEVDAYPVEAGRDGDPIKLGTKRTEYFWDRKIGAGSTPLIAGSSRIAELYEQGDQRRYFVPCPHCDHMAPFVWRGDGGHVMTFDKEKPDEATFTCQANGCVIEHKDKRAMVERGEWRAAKPFAGHASFHIWTAYSYSPNASWAQLVREFLEAKDDPVKLKVFVNTVLGETWVEKGEAPAWERLLARREQYQIGMVPAGVEGLTCGVDVQKDRWVYEVVGWALDKQSWSIDAGVIMGDTANLEEWAKVDALLVREFPTAAGGTMRVRTLAVDSGYRTNTVYNWGRNHPFSRVIAVKGVDEAKVIIGAPTAVDVTEGGKRIARGYKVWPVGVDIAKEELYGWLGLSSPVNGAPFSSGFCHFPEYGEDYFKQLTAEQLVTSTDKKGREVRAWQKLPGRENHWLDARIYARAAAMRLGLDRARPASPPSEPKP